MSEPDSQNQFTLSPADQAAVDAVMDRALPAAPASDADEKRRARAIAWLKVLSAAGVPEAPADLLDRTLGRVAEQRMKLTAAKAADPTAQRTTTEKQIDQQVRRRWSRQVANIAAMVIAAAILGAVTFLGIGQAKQSHLRTLCAENLQKVGIAFAAYAGDNSNQLPALAIPANGNWLANTGPGPARNSANLIPLLGDAYHLTVANLYCAAILPESPPATTPSDLGDIGYSYTNLYGPTRPSWDRRPSTIVLADRNPLFAPAASPNHPANPDANSPNHGGHGNYLLAADGNVRWVTSPNVGPGGDNIWTISRGPERVLNYTGTEVPSAPGDIFLCP